MERDPAYVWWSSLSINEQEQARLAHPFFGKMSKEYCRLHKTSIQQIYEHHKTINPMEKTFDTDYGEALVRNVMLDDGTNLEEGIEIKVNDHLIEIPGWRDLDELTDEQVNQLINDSM